MPKMKTRKAVSSKFRVTGTGKLKMSQPGRRHKLTNKTPKRKRQLRRAALVDEGFLKTYKRLMCL
jgi:large subunit ribosomal protein L35